MARPYSLVFLEALVGAIAEDVAYLCWVAAIGDSGFRIRTNLKSAIADRRYPTKIRNIPSDRPRTDARRDS